jgi:hypothetical protein
MGLEDRLRRVDGVADLTVELGDEGLESIRVRVNEGTDEASVLDEIRRILVAYGLKSRKQVVTDRVVGGVVGAAEGPDRPRITVGPKGDGLYVRLTDGDRIVERVGERSPIGLAQAMVQAVAEWTGEESPSRIALALDELDDTPVVTMLARREGRTAVSAASCAVSLAGGIYQAASEILAGLAPADLSDTPTTTG